MNIKKIFLLFLSSVFFSTAVFCLDCDEYYSGAAISDDGEFMCVASVHRHKNVQLADGTFGDPNPECKDINKEEVWIASTKDWWINPKVVFTFRTPGWTHPSVCYDKANDAFLVFHSSNDASENGFYEFYRTSADYPECIEWKFTKFNIQTGSGFLITNETGIYLVQDQIMESGNEDWFNPKAHSSEIYKLDTTSMNVRAFSVKNLNSIQIMGVPLELNQEFKSIHDLEPVFSTKKGLIIRDYDRETWWYYNCVNESVKKFLSKEDAFDYDVKLEKHRTVNYILSANCWWIICLLVIIAAVIVGLVLLVQILLIKNKAAKSLKNANHLEVSRLVYDTQEQERAAVSRDIHDSVVQDMRGIRLETELLHVDQDSLARQKKIEDMATDCVVKLRNICYNLTPAELTTNGSGTSSKFELVSIIQTLAQQFTERSKIPCSVKIGDGFKYPAYTKEVSLNVFRVVQEALNNIEKHSYATNASIFMQSDNKKMKIFITDDGVGFDTSVIQKHDDGLIHFGLQMMKDRMNLIGGTIKFMSGSNDGTEIQLEFGE